MKRLTKIEYFELRYLQAKESGNTQKAEYYKSRLNHLEKEEALDKYCEAENLKMSKFNPTTIAVIRELQKDVNDLLLLGSNIEVVWKLENLHNMEQAFKQSAELIRKSLN